MPEGLHPLAITMWDFSWIERRWPGAGFESWDEALDQLTERGYDAVRIDAFPHLISADPQKEWTLIPVWYSNDWGSPYINRVRLVPQLLAFLEKCREKRVKVGLSTWYREDRDDVRKALNAPEKMAECWIDTLRLIEDAGLMDVILYVDLCNEWPGDFWAPFFTNDPPWMTWSCWHTDASMAYMRKAIRLVRNAYPHLPYCTRRFHAQGAQLFHPIPGKHRIILVVRNGPAFRGGKRQPSCFRVLGQCVDAVR